MTIESLEIQMDYTIRAGLRKAMQHVDVMDRRDPLHEVKIQLYSYLYDSLHDQILKTHTEGYGAGGDLIRKAGVKVDWSSPIGDATYEDPRIAKMAKAVIAGLEESLDGQADDILNVIVAEYEKGSSTTNISKGLISYFDDNRATATRFARTVTNDVYNRAHIERYEDSGVVDGVQFSAHIDDVTSEICEMLNGTIYSLGDPDIQVPPLHFNCVVAGTQVRTITGMQDIESLQINDLVLTHRNRYMPITDTMNRMADELLEIKTANRTVKVTPNHPILIQRNGHQEWIPAGDLAEGDTVVILE